MPQHIKYRCETVAANEGVSAVSTVCPVPWSAFRVGQDHRPQYAGINRPPPNSDSRPSGLIGDAGGRVRILNDIVNVKCSAGDHARVSIIQKPRPAGT